MNFLIGDLLKAVKYQESLRGAIFSDNPGFLGEKNPPSPAGIGAGMLLGMFTKMGKFLFTTLPKLMEIFLKTSLIS